MQPRSARIGEYHCGPVAQLGARFHGMEEVIGSIPIRSTKSFVRLQLPRSWAWLGVHAARRTQFVDLAAISLFARAPLPVSQSGWLALATPAVQDLQRIDTVGFIVLTVSLGIIKPSPSKCASSGTD